MPTVFLAPGPFGVGGQFFNSNGVPLNAGRIATFAAGTTTPTATYTTAAGTVQNTNPVILNSDGRPPQEIWLLAATGYKFQVVDSVSNLVASYDTLYSIGDPATNNNIGYTGATISGAIIMNLAPINEAQGANIPVASQINLTTTTGNYLSLTGSGTITAIQLSQGAYREFVVNSSSSAFVNSATLALIGGSSFTPAVGDILGFRGEAAPVVRQVLFQKASGAAISVSTTPPMTALSNSLISNVALTNTGLFFDGPSVSVGAIGTWLVTGSIVVLDSSGGATITAKLWDGTTVISSGIFITQAASQSGQIALSGVIASPVGNLKISARDTSTTQGSIVINSSGSTKDSVLTAVRIA